MRIFVAGATGALGRHLIPRLVAADHEVTATTRTPGKVAQLREAGAEPVVVDGLDREGVIAAVLAAAPEVIVHEMTALADMRSLRKIDQVFATTNELRTRGTDNLLAAAAQVGTRRFIAQRHGLERAFWQPGEDRRRSTRLTLAFSVVSAGAGGDQACGADRTADGTGGNCAALRHLLRAWRLGYLARCCAEAAGAGDRRWDGDLVVH